MLYVEKELNSIVFNEEDFKINVNYMPNIVLALRDLDPTKTIHFALDLEKAPAVFIIYFRDLMRDKPELDLKIYYRDQSKLLPEVLKKFNLLYRPIEEYPYELPAPENIAGEVDRFQDLEGWKEAQEGTLEVPRIS